MSASHQAPLGAAKTWPHRGRYPAGPAEHWSNIVIAVSPDTVAIRAAAWLLFLGTFAAPHMVTAQETRAAVIAEQEAEKAAALTPPQPTPAERALQRVSDFLEGPRRGLFPVFDSIYPGGGFTLGIGYQNYLGDRTTWVVRGLYSIRNYKLFDASLFSPGHARGRVDFAAHAGWRDATQIGFYGLGQHTVRGDRANFRLNEAFAGGQVEARPAGPLVLEGRAYYEDYREREGQGASPPITDRFTGFTAPALGSNPSYVHSTAAAGIDWRRSPGYTRTGGLYQIRYQNYASVNDTSSFDRLEADVLQHVPLLRETWVLSLHGRMQTTLGNDTVPYFLLPSLGGGSTLRAYKSQRFRDRHSLLLQGEWRWIPNPLGLDLALFYDAGKVAPRREDLNLRGLKHDVGIGVRFHGPAATPVRMELAKGSEGWKIVFAGSPAF
jgi:hypothetical protein